MLGGLLQAQLRLGLLQAFLRMCGPAGLPRAALALLGRLLALAQTPGNDLILCLPLDRLPTALLLLPVVLLSPMSYFAIGMGAAPGNSFRSPVAGWSILGPSMSGSTCLLCAADDLLWGC